MTIDDYQRIIVPLANAFDQKKIVATGGNGPRSTDSFGEGFFDQYKERLLPSLQGFYSLTNGYSDYWEGKIPTRKKGEKVTERGMIDIVPLEDMFAGHNLVQLEADNNYYIEGEDGFSKTGQFIPIDNIEDICAGVFSKENNDEMMYFHDFGVGFYPLKVNFESYLELAFAARGYIMWQYVLVYLEYGKHDSAKFGEGRFEEFSEDMPLLFPDFKLDEFIELYESLKN